MARNPTCKGPDEQHVLRTHPSFGQVHRTPSHARRAEALTRKGPASPFPAGQEPSHRLAVKKIGKRNTQIYT